MTEQDYIRNLGYLESHRCTHVLMDTLRSGFSAANAIYLAFVLDKFSPEEEKVPETVVFDENGAEMPFSMKVLMSRKQKLFGERAQLSNKMCQLPEGSEYDRERAKFSDLIREVQQQIETLNREMRLKERGFETADGNASDLPKDQIGLIKKLQSLRASRSRKRKQAETAKGDDLKRINGEIDNYNKRIAEIESIIEDKTV